MLWVGCACHPFQLFHFTLFSNCLGSISYIIWIMASIICELFLYNHISRIKSYMWKCTSGIFEGTFQIINKFFRQIWGIYIDYWY
jgi:hypothetical protein